MAMVCSKFLTNDDALINRLGWESLPSGSVCVDIGGGIGTQTSLITKAYPHLKMIVQDQAVLEKQAEEFWASKDPDALSSGRVKWQAQDFFKPQPVEHASVYFICRIMHDWPDNDALRILQNVRDACSPDSKVILGDHLLSFACSMPSNDETRTLADKSEVPKPLLNNLGISGGYTLDLGMMGLFNGQERTIEQWQSLVKKASLKIDRIVGKEGELRYFICLPDK